MAYTLHHPAFPSHSSLITYYSLPSLFCSIQSSLLALPAPSSSFLTFGSFLLVCPLSEILCRASHAHIHLFSSLLRYHLFFSSYYCFHSVGYLLACLVIIYHLFSRKHKLSKCVDLRCLIHQYISSA